MKKQDYFIGLDPGTASVGFAVTDTNYNLIKKGKKHFWGARLFTSGETAEGRRVTRASRISLQRKKERLSLLQEIFCDEINNMDKGFFLRIKESMYHHDDKTEVQLNSLFNDSNFTDKDFFKKYKTIYHLKKDLIEGNVHDPRLLYLAISHILKHRGHFIFQDEGMSTGGNLTDLLKSLNEYVEQEGICEGIHLPMDKLETLLKNQRVSIPNKEKEIKLMFTTKPSDKQLAIIKLIIGGKVKLSELFDDIEQTDDSSIRFKGNYDDLYPQLEILLEDNVALIDHLKAIFDWIRLSDILKEHNYLCEAKIASYNKHKDDIKLLKQLVKEYCPENYALIFSENKKGLANYVSYIYMNKKKNKKEVLLNKKCNQEEFCKFLDKTLKDINVSKKYDDIMQSITLGTFAPKQLTNTNCVIPYQINLIELKAILKASASNFKFLNNEEDGLSNMDKIVSLLTFRIPYYVGHLNSTHDNSWIVRYNNNKIKPWNFSQIVDIEKSAENFITRMTNKCTYLKEFDVLPKDSLIYSKFMVLNEINTIKVNGEDISIDLKKSIYNTVFKNNNKVTMHLLKTFIKKELCATGDIIITGIDKDIKSSLKSENILNTIIPNESDETKENIIKQIVLFSGDKKLLESILTKSYTFSNDVIKKLTNLKFKDWARFSNQFLTTIKDYNKETGELLNIIDMMYETNNNLMQLLSRHYKYLDLINESNNISSNITLETIQDLYCSPSVKKAIWQSFKIVEEIVKVMGCKPKKIFVEIPREEGEKTRTTSRKNALFALYSQIKKEESFLYENLKNTEEKQLRSKKLYLYYTQLGRCAYTNNKIDLENLFNNNIYDIEHIYPRSKSMDDSIINNLVLVTKTANQKKSDDLQIPEQYRQFDLWNKLHSLKLISDEKHKRLVRTADFTKEELEGFINRQLVETSQSTKALIEILNNYLSDTTGKVVYAKAKNVSGFRQHFEITKNRELNDLHHAHDAYLNIVVGNVFDTKFTTNFFKNISIEKYNLVPKKLYNTKFINNDSWNDDTISIVKDSIFNKRVLFTRQSYIGSGQLFNLNPVKKNTGNNIGTPLKKDDRLSDVTKYGSYIGGNPAYYTLVEYIKKDKTIRTLVNIPVRIEAISNPTNNVLNDYIAEEIKQKEFNIIIPKIKLDSLIKFDGMLVHISGGKDVKNAVQLNIPLEQSLYLKYILKTVSTDSYNEKDETITLFKNTMLYDCLREKMGSAIYSKLSTLRTVYDTLTINKDLYTSLPIKEQLLVIKEIMKLFSCTAARANLKLIEGASEAGRQSINLKISTNYSKALLINQSITGIYENEIDLLTVTSKNEF